MAKSDTITRQNLTTHTAGAPWSVRDAANFLGVSARHLARLIDEGKIASIMLGRRRLIADGELLRVSQNGTK